MEDGLPDGNEKPGEGRLQLPLEVEGGSAALCRTCNVQPEQAPGYALPMRAPIKHLPTICIEY